MKLLLISGAKALFLITVENILRTVFSITMTPLQAIAFNVSVDVIKKVLLYVLKKYSDRNSRNSR